MLDFENSENPYEDKRISIQSWKNIAKIYCNSSNEIFELAKKIEQKDIRNKDALHIACAIFSKADYFLTTDKQLLKRI